jgi:hypothetical protein
MSSLLLYKERGVWGEVDLIYFAFSYNLYMNNGRKIMQTTSKINEFLESVSKLPLDDQLMISEIIHKRVIEEKRKELARSVRESKEEYKSNKTKRGSVEDFLNDLENE